MLGLDDLAIVLTVLMVWKDALRLDQLQVGCTQHLCDFESERVNYVAESHRIPYRFRVT